MERIDSPLVPDWDHPLGKAIDELAHDFLTKHDWPLPEAALVVGQHQYAQLRRWRAIQCAKGAYYGHILIPVEFDTVTTAWCNLQLVVSDRESELSVSEVC